MDKQNGRFEYTVRAVKGILGESSSRKPSLIGRWAAGTELSEVRKARHKLDRTRHKLDSEIRETRNELNEARAELNEARTKLRTLIDSVATEEIE